MLKWNPIVHGASKCLNGIHLKLPTQSAKNISTPFFLPKGGISYPIFPISDLPLHTKHDLQEYLEESR